MVTVIVGTQWGDEGKGRVSNFETRDADVVVRCTGGNNAGHTVVRKGEKYALHLLPSSIVEPGKLSVISAGVVINPQSLIEEIQDLTERGIDIPVPDLAISDRAQVTLPIHLELDELQEEIRAKNGKKIGTTLKGIGPTYQEKYGRTGIRMYDLLGGREALLGKLQQIARFHNPLLSAYGHLPYGYARLQEICEQYHSYGCYLRFYIKDTTQIISKAKKEGKKIVLEGAQSTFLDVDWGNYPDVTSSNPTASGTCSGAGIGPTSVKETIGVMKAYCSRVGEGPFPTELNNRKGELIRKLGNEYGTTTGRPRRCGWLDLVMIKYAAELNDLTALALNHMDTIGKFSEFKVCIAYEYHGLTINYVPVDHQNCKPIYKTFKGGWKTEGATTLEELGPNAVEFVKFIENYTGVPVKYIGIGPDAEQTIVRF